MRHTHHIVRTFTARDAAGNTYTIREVGSTLHVQDSEGGGALKGLSRLETTDGEEVDRIEKGRYVIHSTDTEATSDDPNAP